MLEKQDKTNLIYLVLIFIITLVCFILFKGNIDSLYSDIGREFYIIEQLIKGEVLYKDIFCVYAPMGYWINILITKIFGTSLNVFFYISFILSLVCLYLIFSISKIFTNKKLAFFITLTIIPTCICIPSISSFFAPYSFSILYALNFFLASFLLLIKYIQNNNEKLLYLSSILCGLSMTCKYEYSGFLLIIIILTLFKKIEKKKIFYTLLNFIIFPIISLLILLIQKCTLTDLIHSLDYMIELAKTSSVEFFYNFAGLLPNNNGLNKVACSILYPTHYNFFSISGYICILFGIIELILFIKKQEKNILNILLFGTIFVSIFKTLGNINLEIYGTYFLPMIFIGIFSFLYNRIFKKKEIILIVFCILIFCSYLSFDIDKNNLKEINTQKGEIKIKPIFYDTTVKLMSYINENTNKNDKILIIPEGTIINYITNRKSDNINYYLIPPNVEIFKEEKIIANLKNNPPEYIIISNIQYPWYNQTSFINSWGKKITKYIQENYNFETNIGENFILSIYKIKK